MALWRRRQSQIGIQKLASALGCDDRKTRSVHVFAQHGLEPRLETRLSSLHAHSWAQPAQYLHPAHSTAEIILKARYRLTRHRGREPDGRNLSDINSSKRFDSNTDHRHRMAIDE